MDASTDCPASRLLVALRGWWATDLVAGRCTVGCVVVAVACAGLGCGRFRGCVRAQMVPRSPGQLLVAWLDWYRLREG
eukprot:14754841-Alexandrium_andersonii.AAC.1